MVADPKYANETFFYIMEYGESANVWVVYIKVHFLELYISVNVKQYRITIYINFHIKFQRLLCSKEASGK
jgi:hypothetical protein